MWNWLEKITELKQKNIACAVATIVNVSGSTPREVGARLIVDASGQFFGTIGGGQLELQVIAACIKDIKEGKSQSHEYSLCSRTGQCCGGAVTVFVDVIAPKSLVYIFGAGHVGLALAKTLIGTPFEVHALDAREHFINSEEMPKEAMRHHGDLLQMVDHLTWDSEKSYVLIMTHSHSLDEDLLRVILRRPSAYLGLIGSRTKWAKFQSRLIKEGFTNDELGRVRCPIGIPLGAGKAPQEIAVSTAAELLQVYYRKNHAEQQSNVKDQ